MIKVEKRGDRWAVVYPSGFCAGLFDTNAAAWKWVDANPKSASATQLGEMRRRHFKLYAQTRTAYKLSHWRSVQG